MRNMLSLLCFVLAIQIIQAQQLNVYSGGQMTLTSGNPLSWSGLTLTPSGNFNLTGNLEQAATTNISFPSTYVQRVYQFAPATDPFNGNIRIEYFDGELNGLDKNSLELYINNGTSWKGFPATQADPSMNYLEADGISSQLLGEIVLAGSAALPLTWGQASVLREGLSVKLTWITSQETGVSHFDIERSTDAGNWRIVIPGIPARNLTTASRYETIDRSASAEKLFYRIRQTDLDGRFTFSKILVAPAESRTYALSILPNPTKGSFYVDWPDIAGLSSLQLINHAGHILHTWRGGQYQYELPPVPSGTYFIRVQFRDGTHQIRKLQIR
ncbi:MAG: T9SS type A sorting domain-containing protein [Chitinophagaceae bacterium]|nr:T9SS type A sorting domain-containing protein [Chitinophagaceae bacterium]